jgi:hypothetical protein
MASMQRTCSSLGVMTDKDRPVHSVAPLGSELRCEAPRSSHHHSTIPLSSQRPRDPPPPWQPTQPSTNAFIKHLPRDCLCCEYGTIIAGRIMINLKTDSSHLKPMNRVLTAAALTEPRRCCTSSKSRDLDRSARGCHVFSIHSSLSFRTASFVIQASKSQIVRYPDPARTTGNDVIPYDVPFTRVLSIFLLGDQSSTHEPFGKGHLHIDLAIAKNHFVKRIE